MGRRRRGARGAGGRAGGRVGGWVSGWGGGGGEKGGSGPVAGGEGGDVWVCVCISDGWGADAGPARARERGTECRSPLRLTLLPRFAIRQKRRGSGVDSFFWDRSWQKGCVCVGGQVSICLDEAEGHEVEPVPASENAHRRQAQRALVPLAPRPHAALAAAVAAVVAAPQVAPAVRPGFERGSGRARRKRDLRGMQ